MRGFTFKTDLGEEQLEKDLKDQNLIQAMMKKFDHENKFTHVTREILSVGQLSRARDKIRKKCYKEAKDRSYIKEHVKKLESETK